MLPFSIGLKHFVVYPYLALLPWNISILEVNGHFISGFFFFSLFGGDGEDWGSNERRNKEDKSPPNELIKVNVALIFHISDP
jgi:hypothetical protein